MKQFSIISMILLSIILIVFVVMVPKYPDIKNIDLRNTGITEIINKDVQEKLE